MSDSKYAPVLHRGHQDTAQTEMTRLLEVIAEQSLELTNLRAELAAKTAECQALLAYKLAVEEHNAGCQSRCGIGDQEAVECKYRPYFLNSRRRCPNCPTYEMIDVPAALAKEQQT